MSGLCSLKRSVKLPLLLPAAGPDAEKLAAAINRLLLGFYRHKADFARRKDVQNHFRRFSTQSEA